MKVAIRYKVAVVSSAMRYVFLRESLSLREAQLMDLLTQNKSWGQIADLMGYNNAKAAANTGDRIFDKLIPPYQKDEHRSKRNCALEIWQRRNAGVSPAKSSC